MSSQSLALAGRKIVGKLMQYPLHARQFVLQSLNVLLTVVYRALQAAHGLLFARIGLVAYEFAIDQGQTRLCQGFFLIRQFRHQNLTATLVAM